MNATSNQSVGALDGKVAVVTGSTRGIGRAIAECFVREGARVVVNGRRAADTEDAAAAIGGDVLPIAADVSERGQADHLIAATVERCGRVDVLVNNAAVALDHFLTRVPDEEWERTLAVNLSGPFFTTRAVARIMKQQGGGSIVNVTSYAGLRGREGQVPYSASKAGLLGLTLACAKELGRFGIRVNALAPAAITDMARQVPLAKIEEALRDAPLGRVGSLEDVAEGALFLASDRSRATTGQVLNADGGWHLR